MASALAKVPEGPKETIPGTILVKFRRDPLAYLTHLARQYGDLVYFKLGGQPIYLLNDPAEIQNILVTNNKLFKKSRGLQVAKRFLGEGLLTSEGDFHRRQRRLVQPAFHHQRIEAYADEMARQAERLRERWKDGQLIDMSQEMMKLTLAVVARTLFDADVDREASEIRDAINEIMHLFTFTLTLPFADLLEKVLVFPKRRFERARSRLDAVIYRMISEHRAGGTDRGDLLSMLLASRDEETDGGGMTDQQVRDEAMTLFLAGHETTANALTWTWYLLSQHPEVEEKLHAELHTVLGEKLPSAQDAKQLTYTTMVLSESMRLYPPAWTLGRQALTDYRIGNQILPAGSIILMSQFVTHRDARFFPEPDRFLPERWTPEAIATRPRFSYFPFGGGPRVCIGEPFAWIEGTIILATLARKWKARLVKGHKVGLEPLITLRPKHGIPMTLLDRAGSASGADVVHSAK